MTKPVDPEIADLSKLLEGFVAAPVDAALRDHLSRKPDWFDTELDRLLVGQSDVGADVQALAKLLKRINRELNDAFAAQDRKLDETRSVVDALAVAQEAWREERQAAHAAVMQDGAALRAAVAALRRRQVVLAPCMGIAAVVVIEIIHHLP
jgi:hypothetical protein